jgi:O-6-methylguanine DNA methyltransferase
MSDIGLRDLVEPAPDGFADRVLVAVGLADRYVVRPSPVGDVAVAHNANGISACRVLADVDGDGTSGHERDRAEFEAWFARRFGRPVVADDAPPRALLHAVDALLAGGRPRRMPAFDLTSVSPFARDVLTTAVTIPAGQVRPYGWVSARIGKPGAVRAVGSALGHNPVPLLIPCHRVVRSDGRIGEYAFGPAMKRALLRAEGVDPDELEALAARRVRYVGSRTTSIYCHPTCVDGRRVMARNRVTFPDAAAAVEAGYRACKHCEPLGPNAAAVSPGARGTTTSSARRRSPV